MGQLSELRPGWRQHSPSSDTCKQPSAFFPGPSSTPSLTMGTQFVLALLHAGNRRFRVGRARGRSSFPSFLDRQSHFMLLEAIFGGRVGRFHLRVGIW